LLKENIEILLSLGSNLGDRKGIIIKAVELLTDNTVIEKVILSNFYETEPVGPKDQPFFINIALRAETSLEPLELLARLKEIEADLGRVKRERWKEREIDIDVLLYGDLILDNPHITIPHPRMHERNFVLVPAVEIAPDMMHPVFNAKLSHLLDISKDNSKVVPL
jgi:2-amino-4-hydroxy-6-hydroxymethyldihydropteridine diphosphokinase